MKGEGKINLYEAKKQIEIMRKREDFKVDAAKMS